MEAQGTTSAYAENTGEKIDDPEDNRNYLRVRGEYRKKNLRRMLTMELPPRTRRIRPRSAAAWRHLGTTSAYAENTPFIALGLAIAANYLRVRGEYSLMTAPIFTSVELPPRTRRILANDTASLPNAGTTSAYAENT